jgi:hypothetical protein
MRKCLNSRVAGWLRAGAFWTAVLVVLPNCSFDPSGLASSRNLTKGTTPHNDLIFCDIERPSGRHCSTALERARGIRLAEAAIALAEGRTTDVGLDDSPDALARCGGEPEAVLFQGPFPQGFPVCLNCGEAIGISSQPTVTVACQAQCYDFFGTTDAEGDVIPEVPAAPGTVEFCNAVSRPSTSFANDMCYLGACDAGAIRDDFVDPRRSFEPVVWRDLIGVATGGAAGNDLTRTAPLTSEWDAGAVSTQWITRGDAFVEFAVADASQLHVIGLSEIPSGCASPCPDTNAHFNPIAFAVHFKFDARVYLLESGAGIVGPDVDGSFGTYAPGERFRVSLQDNGDGTAQVRYTRVVGTCVPGTMCNETDLFVSVTPARYPLRVDTSLFTPGASLTDVRLVRIR